MELSPVGVRQTRVAGRLLPVDVEGAGHVRQQLGQAHRIPDFTGASTRRRGYTICECTHSRGNTPRNVLTHDSDNELPLAGPADRFGRPETE